MLDSLADVADQLHQEFPAVPLRDVIDIVRQCKDEIDTGAPADCMPELAYRMARVRLAEVTSN
jgi:hypothetical protein